MNKSMRCNNPVRSAGSGRVIYVIKQSLRNFIMIVHFKLVRVWLAISEMPTVF